jgi:hypothetical protein
VRAANLNPDAASESFRQAWQANSYRAFDDGGLPTFWLWLQPSLGQMTWDELEWSLSWLDNFGQQGSEEWRFALGTLTMLRDRPIDPGKKRRASILGMVDETISRLLDGAVALDDKTGKAPHIRRLSWHNRAALRPAEDGEQTLVIDASQFPPEGGESAARFMVLAYEHGWRHLVVYNWRGGRFAGSGLGPNSDDVRIDLYGDVGDMPRLVSTARRCTFTATHRIRSDR